MTGSEIKPTREEFEERRTKHVWFSLFFGTPSFLFLLGYAIWFTYFAPPFEFPVVLMLHGMVLSVGLTDFWFLYVFMAEKYGLICTDCGKSTVRHIRSTRTLDEGKCPWCDSRVWRWT